jgi:phage shock protein A
MLNDLKKLFARTWDAFTAEAGRREPEDQVAEILSGMRREMVDARAALPVYEESVRAAEREAARERQALEDAVRRGGLAERIGDAETVRIAAEFAERHRKRVAVLDEKVRAARAEHELRTAEVGEMMRRYKEADLNRFALLNAMRRASSSERIREGATLGDDEFARAAERIEHEAAYGDALSGLDDSSAPPPPPSADDVEARLQEMKRRMGL